MNIRQRPQFSRFLLRHSITQEIAAANLRAGQIFDQIRFTQRGMEFNVKMKTAIITAISRRLM